MGNIFNINVLCVLLQHKELSIKKGISLCFFLHFLRFYFSVSLQRNQKQRCAPRLRFINVELIKYKDYGIDF